LDAHNHIPGQTNRRWRRLWHFNHMPYKTFLRASNAPHPSRLAYAPLYSGATLAARLYAIHQHLASRLTRSPLYRRAMLAICRGCSRWLCALVPNLHCATCASLPSASGTCTLPLKRERLRGTFCTHSATSAPFHAHLRSRREGVRRLSGLPGGRRWRHGRV